jgi:type IV secretion system protein VirB6
MQISAEVINIVLNTDFGLHHINRLMHVVDLDVTNLIFFTLIKEFLNNQIDNFGASLFGRTASLIAAAGVTLMTIWIMIQGFRIVTGQSRDSMAALVTNSLKATFILGLAGVWSAMSSDVYEFLSDDVQSVVTGVVTNDDDDVYKKIDKNLGLMQLAFISIDGVQEGSSQKVSDSKSRAMWFTGLGTAGPALTGGVMLLLNKIAMALFVGLGPIFIVCLLFDQTKSLFQRWLLYGLGTMFSLAVLSVMVTIAMDLVIAVAGSFWVLNFVGGSAEGVNSMAMQQGGLGLILTMLIISAPPMASNFFQGTLGQFLAYSQFGGSAGTQPGVRGAGSPPTTPAAPVTNPDRTTTTVNQTAPQLTQGQNTLPVQGSEIRSADAARLAQAGGGTLPPPQTPLAGGTNTSIAQTTPTRTDIATPPPQALPPKPAGGNDSGGARP